MRIFCGLGRRSRAWNIIWPRRQDSLASSGDAVNTDTEQDGATISDYVNCFRVATDW